LFLNHLKNKQMKKQSLLIILGLVMVLPFISNGQTETNRTIPVKSETKVYGPKKGEFHIGIQDIRLQIYGNGRSFFNFSPRIGYMITDKDMVFVDAYFSNIFEDDLWKNIEVAINYRRYFGKNALKPFAQGGIGYGYFPRHQTSYYGGSEKDYIHANIGAGLSYRYKRWSIEAGLELEYNQFNNDAIVLKPMVGVSFSF